MSSSSTASDPIPRYIRYKAEDKRGDEYWDDELERVNKIVHDRVQRMKRDKLCSGCARFDWIRTQFYSREAAWGGGKLPLRNNVMSLRVQKFPGSTNAHNYLGVPESLVGFKDNVSWLGYEAALPETLHISELMNHPRFEWDIDHSQQQSCTLCQSLCRTATAIEPLATHRTSVRCLAGPLMEGGKDHDCRIGLFDGDNGYNLGEQSINAIIFDICPKSEKGSYLSGFRRCYLRPIARKTGILPSVAPHCCLITRSLGRTVDFSLVAGWLKTCDNTHQHANEVETRDLNRNLPGFRLIDVTKRCIVQSGLNERYAALSYTWDGKEQYCLTQRNLTALEQVNSLDGTNSLLAPTAIDSMEVCRRLQIRYLWIDALCIIQDDVQGKHLQIKHMNQVYGNAYLTIVSASRNRPSGYYTSGLQTALPGLAGVSIPRSSGQIIVNVDTVTYSIRPTDPLHSLDCVLGQSHWFSRGWTFQELIMSRRICVFTESEVFFYCPNGLFTESTCLGNNANESIQIKSMERIRLCNFLRKSPSLYSPATILPGNRYSHYWGIYLKLLSAYIGRELSFESDILNAFGGILSAQESVLGKFYWGLPLCLFVRSLLLNLRLAHDFRTGFPSWSWAGKRLVFNYSSKKKGIWEGLGLYSKKLRALVHIYTYEEHGHLELLVGPHSYCSGSEGYCSIFIETFNRYTLLEPLPVHPSMTRDTCVAKIPTEMGFTLLFWTQTACITTTTWRRGTEVVFDFGNPPERFEVILVAGILRDDAIGWGKELADNVKSLDGLFDQNRDQYYGIVIERQGDYARRIGVLEEIRRKDWIAAKPRKELIRLI
ncbi:heterokaryon incompatibility protein-domain-containing protein [Paraphoma chrysanthemicola]|uniref:Heterokaryon incompatibility protein-domain-containing protein n=1 Tax=Paraphoma chrysanthemicola TaxID=798071 RepID=A0A8K0QQY8_9PLEO|nr:heterokaryon incompatibility protein-domain-containing protein [Paraphoma chrysanthemicola]